MIIVVGGYDVVYIPEYDYGVYKTKIRTFCVKFALKNADYILPNNQSLIYNINTYSNNYHRKEGIKYFVPNTKAKIITIHNGYDIDFWVKKQILKKENTVITVASIKDYRTFKLKGIDCFIKIAELLPKYKFIIIGMTEDLVKKLKIKIPTNLKLISEIPQIKLIDYYQKSKVFCILSLTEGMSNVLCEAMLCECIPVGTNVNFIPEIIKKTGFIIYKNDINEMKNKIKKALLCNDQLGLKAKERILINYSLKRREKRIVKLFNEILLS